MENLSPNINFRLAAAANMIMQLLMSNGSEQFALEMLDRLQKHFDSQYQT